VSTGRGANVETGAEGVEDSRGQPLCEYIGILKGCRNMKYPDGTKSYALPDDMKINLHMLGPLVINEIS
jgi:hypothetical protein